MYILCAITYNNVMRNSTHNVRERSIGIESLTICEKVCDRHPLCENKFTRFIYALVHSRLDIINTIIFSYLVATTTAATTTTITITTTTAKCMNIIMIWMVLFQHFITSYNDFTPIQIFTVSHTIKRKNDSEHEVAVVFPFSFNSTSHINGDLYEKPGL